MKVLITGGAGYIGRSLVDRLEKDNRVNQIIVLDNMISSTNSFFIGEKKILKLKFIKGDILNFDLIEELVKDVDAIYHLAAYTKHAYTYQQNIQYEQINQWGTLNLVRAIKNNGKNLKQFIYLSSIAIFGLRKNIDIKVDSPQPSNAYGKSKLEGEKYASLLKDNCEVVIIRSGNVFGFNSGFRQDLVLNNFIFNGLVNKKIIVFGDGTQTRPFTSLNKLCNELIESLNSSQPKKHDVVYKNIIEFNASLNDLKDWLLTYIPSLEYTYLNTNISYDGQSIQKSNTISDYKNILEETFQEFNNNISIV